MSLPNKIKLSKRARIDFEDILIYTVSKWGEEKMITYRNMIHDALEILVVHPHSGSLRRDYPKNYRSYIVGSHMIIYRYEKDALYISRILHQKMDIDNLLQDSESDK